MARKGRASEIVRFVRVLPGGEGSGGYAEYFGGTGVRHAACVEECVGGPVRCVRGDDIPRYKIPAWLIIFLDSLDSGRKLQLVAECVCLMACLGDSGCFCWGGATVEFCPSGAPFRKLKDS